MPKQINHIEKKDLPNPFQCETPIPRPPKSTQRPADLSPEIKTITIKATTIKPGQLLSTPPTPGDRQPMTMGSPMGRADQPAHHPGDRPQMDTQAAVDFFAGFGEAIAIAMSEFINGLMLGGDMFGAFFGGFGSAFSLDTKRPKRKVAMALAYYSIYCKLANPVTRLLETEIYQVTPIEYRDDKFIFAVPIKLYKVCEKMLNQRNVEYERIDY